MGDEEAHVVAAMLRNNITIEQLQFRNNNIGDDGARAIAAVLAERSALKLVDLRENHISIIGVKTIADALERSERIHKVMVHPGGKIEAFGASESIDQSESTELSVKTVCIVDLRDNQPKGDPTKTQTEDPIVKRNGSMSSKKGPKSNGKQRASLSAKQRPRKSRAASADAPTKPKPIPRQSASAPKQLKPKR